MGKVKWYESGKAWQIFREKQAERFGMKPEKFATFFKSYPAANYNEELVHGVVLNGKTEIAAFLGITVKTLETWRDNSKYDELPIQWGSPGSQAKTDCLLCWKVRNEASKIPDGLKRAAIAHAMGISCDTLRSYLPIGEKRVVFKKNYSRDKLEATFSVLNMRRMLKTDCPFDNIFAQNCHCK